MTRHQYGISVVDRQTSFRGKHVEASGNIDCFSLPKTWGKREKVTLTMKIIVAGLKSREIQEENAINSLQPVITVTQRKDIKNMFLRRENIKRINNF